jgi:hypothetical protein
MSDSNDFWKALCGSLGIDDTSSMAEILEAADQLRAAFDVQGEIANVAGGESALMIPVVEAAKTWYLELLRLGHYKPGEVLNFSSLRSDRWPPEVDLAAATDRYLTSTNRSVDPEGEALLK